MKETQSLEIKLVNVLLTVLFKHNSIKLFFLKKSVAEMSAPH